ncbi:MAG: FAD-binding oxidoreductase [Acidimicrobiia bacterium]
MTSPRLPIDVVDSHAAAGVARAAPERVEVGRDVERRLMATGAMVSRDIDEVIEHSRDWWPVALVEAAQGRLLAVADLVVAPQDAAQIVAIVDICRAARVPITASGGRSGVSGGAVPLAGGVALDLGRMQGITRVDPVAGLVSVRAGTNGAELERELRSQYALTCGHWPQSMELASVGGWAACRGAGQFSNRYGTMADIVAGLEVVLADGSVIRTDAVARSSIGPDLTSLFLGSEGTLGIIAEVTLRCHPVPTAEHRASFLFDSFTEANEACRRIMRRGVRPAVLRAYDLIETKRLHDAAGAMLLVFDEGDSATVAVTAEVVAAECLAGVPLGAMPVDRWFEHRNDVSVLGPLVERGLIVDTMEVAAPWSALDEVHRTVVTALDAFPGCLVVSAHQSHSYIDGACLYFTFAGQADAADRRRWYFDCWDVAQRAALRSGANLSHHHGVGVNRARFMPDALGGGLAVLRSLKAALDPTGILNPGKLGL